MAKLHPFIDETMAQWIAAQPLFFVGTAPLSAEGHVNISPRGLDSFRVVGPRRVAYLDLTGSGNESAAHLSENGRITLMFCAFEGKSRILRLYGLGKVVLPRHAQWAELRSLFPSDLIGERQIVVVEISRIQSSCGFGVPLMEFRSQRDELAEWARKKGDALPAYRAERNSISIDGLRAPGFEDL